MSVERSQRHDFSLSKGKVNGAFSVGRLSLARVPRTPHEAGMKPPCRRSIGQVAVQSKGQSCDDLKRCIPVITLSVCANGATQLQPGATPQESANR